MPLIPSRLSWVACDKGAVVDLISKALFQTPANTTASCVLHSSNPFSQIANPNPSQIYESRLFCVDGTMARLCSLRRIPTVVSSHTTTASVT